MKKCLLCNTQLTSQNQTLEHIIPKIVEFPTPLTSVDILCNSCNSATGAHIDPAWKILTDFMILANNGNLYNGRENSPSVTLTDSVGIKYKYDGNTYKGISNKKMPDGTLITTPYGLEDVIKNLRKKGKSYSLRSDTSTNNNLTYETAIDINKLKVAFLKIAIEFAYYNGVQRNDLINSVSVINLYLKNPSIFNSKDCSIISNGKVVVTLTAENSPNLKNSILFSSETIGGNHYLGFAIQIHTIHAKIFIETSNLNTFSIPDYYEQVPKL